MSRLDPASAVAESKCWLARQPRSNWLEVIGRDLTSVHPKPCNWCVYPLDALLRWVETYNARVGFVMGEMRRNQVIGRTEPDKNGKSEPIYGDVWHSFETPRPGDEIPGDGRFADPEAQAFYALRLGEQRAAAWRAAYGDEGGVTG